MIELTDLTKRYGDKTAVDHLTVTVRSGTVTGFLGPNGSGKSTTLRLILGLNAPSSGAVTVDGHPFTDRPRGLRHVGALLDAQDIHGGRSAVAHLKSLAVSNRIPLRRVGEVLEEVGLAEAGRKRIGGYSLGMKQRLGIAGALLGDPPVLLFDEPLNGLDPEGVRWVREMFQRLAKEGRTVFVSSHLMSEMEHTAERLVVIGRGHLIADETLSEFSRRGSQATVLVRTPEAAALAAILTAEGADVQPAAADSAADDDADADGDAGGLAVVGLPAPKIGELAWRNNIMLAELATQNASLEKAFMELTADAVEYAAGEAR
ncbi:ATP-binding cassette domain-containing protein [Catenulispora sp. NF23]|uniref:ATP-binding cassette domain-containing protein n=1 Tax=Catenulispora pinistramenti TaxID=2705254 RepID=A0ABS5L6Y2_9ACTN|nr:ATP-binding cassette domain-containing protein [Catenulispora pinistramenti]MBS2538751.1 ATP-binding cassette domain-containing protein [Catenulispora pinistramenti]MBS2554077.1 ATP-binding cassette domain-containing protein [Catenulispora pinistramenti]